MHKFSVEGVERLFWMGPGDPLRMTPSQELVWDRAPADEDLRRALEHIHRRYPLLTCRLVTRWGRCWWEGPWGDPVGRSIERRELPPGDDGNLEERRDRLRNELLMEPMRAELGELYRTFCIPLPGGKEWWLVPTHEMAGDGHGFMGVLNELLGYLRDPSGSAEPDDRPRRLEKLPPRNFREARRLTRGMFPRGLESPWRPTLALAPRRARYLRFAPPVLDRLRARGKEAGGTFTDVIHALIVRALESVGGFACRRGDEEWIRICFLVDLRRLADRSMGLASFVGVGAITLRCPVASDPMSLVREVARQKAAIVHPSCLAPQARIVRLANLFPVPLLARRNRRMLLAPAGISATVSSVGDMGRLLPNALDLPISHAGGVGFPHPSVPFVLLISSFRGALTVANTVIEDAVDDGRAGKALDCLKEEVERFAGVAAGSSSQPSGNGAPPGGEVLLAGDGRRPGGE